MDENYYIMITLIGKYYGYPDCCIDEFTETQFFQKKRLHPDIYDDEIMQLKNVKGGFLPCVKHMKMIINDEVTIKDLIYNRICETEYPNFEKNIIKMRIFISTIKSHLSYVRKNINSTITFKSFMNNLDKNNDYVE